MGPQKFPQIAFGDPYCAPEMMSDQLSAIDPAAHCPYGHARWSATSGTVKKLIGFWAPNSGACDLALPFSSAPRVRTAVLLGAIGHSPRSLRSEDTLISRRAPTLTQAISPLFILL
jgi:hypothetical protein